MTTESTNIRHRELWERRPGESETAYHAFECYLDMPPGERTLEGAYRLHYPPPTPQPLAALYPAPGDPHLYAASAKEPSAARVIVPFICMELVGSLARPASLALHGRDRVDELLKNRRVMHVGRGQDRGERYAVRISDDVALGARSAPV